MLKICPECLNINNNKEFCGTCGFPFTKKIIGKIDDFIFYDSIELVNIGNVKEAKEKVAKRLSEEKNVKLELLLERIDSIISTITESDVLAEKASFLFQTGDYNAAAKAISKAIEINPSPRLNDLSSKIETVLLKLDKEKIASDKFKKGISIIENGSEVSGLNLIKEAVELNPENVNHATEYKIRLANYVDSIERRFNESLQNRDLIKCELIIGEASNLLSGNDKYSEIIQVFYTLKESKENKKKNKRTFIFLLLGFALIGIAWFLVGKYNDSKNWQHTQKERTIKAYQNFIERYTESDYIFDAKNELSELLALDSTKWNQYLNMPSGKTIHEYIDSLTPYGGLQLTEAQLIADSIDWGEISNSGVTAVYEKYLIDHPNSRYNTMARKKISLDVSQSERMSLIQYVNDYFTYYASKDLETIMNYYGPIIPVFGPNKNITKADLRLILENDLKNVLESRFSIDTSSFVVSRLDDGNENIEFYSDVYTTKTGVASDGSAGTSEQSEITYFTNMQWNIVIDQTRKFVKYNYKIISEQPINQ